MSNEVDSFSHNSRFLQKLDKSKKIQIISLSVIIASALIWRLVNLPFDTPLFNDAMTYFWYAIDMSVLNKFPEGHVLTNNGWPIFISFIFKFLNSENFLDYHNIMRVFTVMISVTTIIPIYFLCLKFMNRSFALIGVVFFAFEPRLMQNSLIGTPESMHIFLLAISFVLFLSENLKKIYLSFFIIGLLSLIRYEGLLFIIPLSVMFFVRFRGNKKKLLTFIFCFIILLSIITPVTVLRIDSMGEDGLISHISAGPEYYKSAIDSGQSSLPQFFEKGFTNSIKFLGWLHVPIYLIFVPVGFFLFFRKFSHKKMFIVLSLVMILIPAFYAYSRDFSEIKYLLPLTLIFPIFAYFTIKKILNLRKNQNIIYFSIVFGIIISSLIFSSIQVTDFSHYKETYEILSDMGDREIVINGDFGTFGGEFTLLHWIRLNNVDEFPILSKDLPDLKMKTPKQFVMMENTDNKENNDIVWFDKSNINSFEEYITVLKKQGVTHLLLDQNNNVRLINDNLREELRYIFHNEEEFPFLIKEYDSKEKGYKNQIKLFKINYELINKIEIKD